MRASARRGPSPAQGAAPKRPPKTRAESRQEAVAMKGHECFRRERVGYLPRAGDETVVSTQGVGSTAEVGVRGAGAL